MKKNLTLTAFLAVALVIALAFASITYAWLFTGDIAKGLEYSIAKIDSTVTLHRAVDDNMNGVPNRLAENVQLEYYSEQYEFEQLGDPKFALSDDSEANLLTSFSITDFVPTQHYTLKYSLVNKSTAENLITFKLSADEIDNEAFLSTLSFRLGVVNAADASSTATVEFGEKVFLADIIEGGAIAESVLSAAEENIFIDGMTGDDITTNYRDFWLQIEMETFETLSTHAGFTLDEEEYNSLQGSSATLPFVYVYFEIIV